MRLRYRENMTAAQEAAFMATLKQEEACWALADVDGQPAPDDETAEEACQQETLTGAALNCGRP
jgi:hypothetical protein